MNNIDEMRGGEKKGPAIEGFLGRIDSLVMGAAGE